MAPSLRLERIEPGPETWGEMDAFADRNVFQTREWLAFVAKTQGVELVVAAVKEGSTNVGYFTGLVDRRFGLRILGSPGPGWATWYMGFSLCEGTSRRAALEALASFAFGPLRCQHIELGDREMTVDDTRVAGAHVDMKLRVEIDLRRSEDEIWAEMSSACRRCIRKANKSGVVVEEVSDIAFADEYYDQLIDVFAKQGRTPVYDRERVHALIAELQPTGRLLLLRARDQAGRGIATGIFAGTNRAAYFWGGASWREHQGVRPNEAIMWHAVRHWKARGVEAIDLGGVVDYPYKRKYGVSEVRIPFVSLSKYSVLAAARALSLEVLRRRRRMLRRFGEIRHGHRSLEPRRRERAV